MNYGLYFYFKKVKWHLSLWKTWRSIIDPWLLQKGYGKKLSTGTKIIRTNLLFNIGCIKNNSFYLTTKAVCESQMMGIDYL